jgi:hypothetical protein
MFTFILFAMVHSPKNNEEVTKVSEGIQCNGLLLSLTIEFYKTTFYSSISCCWCWHLLLISRYLRILGIAVAAVRSQQHYHRLLLELPCNFQSDYIHQHIGIDIVVKLYILTLFVCMVACLNY